MTQEFHLSVTPVGEDEYLIRTERVAPGVPLAEEQVSWPVESWLQQARQLMHDPLLSVLQGDRSFGGAARLDELPEPEGAEADLELQRSQPALNLVALGQEFYQALFQGTIRDSWMTAQGIAQHRREVLRLRLGLKGARLARLPWEVLHTAERNSVGGAPRPVATGTDVLFSRYQPSPGLVNTPGLRELMLGQQQPLKILMAIAGPTDQEHLELKREAIHLQEELSGRLGAEGSSTGRLAEIQLTILDQPDREQLTQALEQGQFQVLHYAGHSNLGVAGGNLYLVNRKTGLTEVLSGDDLAGLLVNNGIRMAVFNSCRSAHTATSELEHEIGEQSLAEALVRRGIPGVLAMAERIPDEVALTLTRLFYRNLKQGYPVDLSLSRARQGLISAYGSRQLYWALPTLYLHPEFDAQLVAVPNLDLYNASLEMPNARWRSPSDRTPDPARSPQPYDPADPGAAMPGFAGVPGEEDADFFADDEADLTDYVDDLEWDDDLASDEDSALVAELIEQLSQNRNPAAGSVEEPFTPASPTENLLVEPDPTVYVPPLDARSNQGKAVANSGSPTDVALDPQLQRALADWELGLVDPPDLTSAIATARQAIQRNPHDVDAYNQLGLALYRQGNLAEAIAAYKKALQINPSLTEVYSNLALALYKQGNLREAQNAYQQATRQVALTAPPSERSSANLFNPNLRGAWLRRGRSPQRWWWLLAGAGALAVVLLGLWFFRQREPQLAIPPIPTSAPLGASSSFSVDPATGQALLDLKAASTNDLTAAAVDYFGRNQLVAGEQVVTELLNRVALAQARAALAAVPAESQDQPAISFLRGRYAWQAIQTGNKDFSVDDARRYWETAVQRQEELGTGNAAALPRYYNALGFAYYAEGNLNRANQAWFKASYLLEERQTREPDAAVASAPGQASPAPEIKPNSDSLTAYAGLAMAFAKSARTQAPEKQANLQTEAAKLHQMVMKADPVAFQPPALSQNWLWTEAAIADWQALTRLQTNP